MRIVVVFDSSQVFERSHELRRSLEREFPEVDLEFVRRPLQDWGKKSIAELRDSFGDAPVILMNHLDSSTDRIIGLEIDARDLLRNVLRRVVATTVANSNTDESVYIHGPVRVDLDRYLAFVSDHELDLTKTELLLLETLMRRPTRVYSRDELAEGAYGPGTYVSPRTINSHIRRIRQEFEDYDVDPIVTVRGVGYRMSRFNGDEEE